MPHTLYWIFEGVERVERGKLPDKIPIDIRTEANPAADTMQIGEVSNIEELKMFFSDYRWSKGITYFLRDTSELDNDVRTSLLGILHTKEDRRSGEVVVPEEVQEKRRPRTYRTNLIPKYKRPQK